MPKQTDGPPEKKSAPQKQAAGDSQHSQAPADAKQKADQKSNKRPEKDPALDPLVRDRIYPEPHNVFAFVPVELKDALGDGIVAIDTNVLVLPYGTGANSLKEITTVYAQLTEQKKLRIPAQVAREFADVRAGKLTTLYQQLQSKQSINDGLGGKYPLLEGMTAYEEMRKAEVEISAAIKKIRKDAGELLEAIAQWRWNDPVSSIYRKFFTSDIVIEPTFDRKELLEELEYRNLHKVPPGYKDAAKDDSGIGDLLIWKTLLSIGAKEMKHLVFVTGEEKPDWWYRANNKVIYPRFELIDEYRRASKGKSLVMTSFSKLLKACKVSADVVAEVQEAQREEAASKAVPGSGKTESLFRQYLHYGKKNTDAVVRWVLSLHPQAAIEFNDGFPDFYADRDEGYEVKLFGSFMSASTIVTQSLARADSHYHATGIPVNLVFVVRDTQNASALYRLIHRLEEINPRTRIIIGQIVEDEVFEPIWTIDPGDLDATGAGVKN